MSGKAKYKQYYKIEARKEVEADIEGDGTGWVEYIFEIEGGSGKTYSINLEESKLGINKVSYDGDEVFLYFDRYFPDGSYGLHVFMAAIKERIKTADYGCLYDIKKFRENETSWNLKAEVVKIKEKHKDNEYLFFKDGV